MGNPPSPSVYRTRAYRIRQRVLTGLAAVGLLLAGYLIGRWQDTPAEVATLPSAGSVAPAPAGGAPETAPSSAAPEPIVYPTLQAESASASTGVEIEDTEDEGGGQNAGYIRDGDSLRFDDFDFGPVPATKVDVRVASDADDDDDGRMEIRLDSRDAAAVGTLRVTRTGGWQDWRTDEVTLTEPVTGVHTVHLVFLRNDDDEFVNINWLLFGR